MVGTLCNLKLLIMDFPVLNKKNIIVNVIIFICHVVCSLL